MKEKEETHALLLNNIILKKLFSIKEVNERLRSGLAVTNKDKTLII